MVGRWKLKRFFSSLFLIIIFLLLQIIDYGDFLKINSECVNWFVIGIILLLHTKSTMVFGVWVHHVKCRSNCVKCKWWLKVENWQDCFFFLGITSHLQIVFFVFYNIYIYIYIYIYLFIYLFIFILSLYICVF
jgi:hypothetical protein